MKNPSSLVSRIFKAKYFPTTHVLKATKGRNPSFIWTSIWTAKEELKSGFRWVLGNGNDIVATTDPCLRIKAGFCVDRNPMCFLQHDADVILEVPIPQRDSVDRIAWTGSDNGIYSAKTVRNRLISKGMRVPITYPMCLSDIEHLAYLLFDCPFAAACWEHVNMSFNWQEIEFAPDWLLEKITTLNSKDLIFEAEIVGIREALTWLKDQQFYLGRVIVETDSMLTISAIMGEGENNLEVQEALEDCKQKLSEMPLPTVRFVRKNSNRVAHEFARFPCLANDHIVFTSLPTCVLEALTFDRLN
ncbi:hypothetical protein AgCh_009015 [Apium graveolens]